MLLMETVRVRQWVTWLLLDRQGWPGPTVEEGLVALNILIPDVRNSTG